MEIWQYIEILRTSNKSCLSLKDNTEEKIEALRKIAVDGYLSLICYLTDSLKDSNKRVRDTACKTIIHLFKKVDSKRGLYDSLKYCGISSSDLDFYEENYPTEQFVELLAISSLNGNGYVREKAVKKLSQAENPRAIQFLIYRLADWVLPVRLAALQGIENYKSVQYIDSLIENLPTFEWLRKVERTDLSGVYQEIIEFIATANRDYVIANYKKYPDKIRLLLARHISNSLTDKRDELELLLSDKHFLIRNFAIDHFNKLKQNEIDQLLNDKSAKIRLRTLYCLKKHNEFNATVKHYLADPSATIRHFARFTLQPAGIDFADFYNQNLQEGNQIIGSLNGLAEVDAKNYSGRVKKYLNDKKIKIKKTAFSALCKLEPESAYEFAFANMDCSFVGLRKIIIEYLSQTPRQEVVTKARAIYQTGDYELKKSMLQLFNKIGGWTAIPDLMIGTIDENENIRQLAFSYLQIWRTKAVRLFLTPKQEEIESAQKVFNFTHETHETHEDKRYFKTNPLDGLDFYFK